MPKKKVSKKTNYDSLVVDATYESGGKFRFYVGRSGERITLGGASGEEGKKQLAVVVECCKFKGQETNGERLERLYALAQQANSVGELVDLMK